MKAKPCRVPDGLHASAHDEDVFDVLDEVGVKLGAQGYIRKRTHVYQIDFT